VKSYGARLVTDRTKSLEHAVALVEKLGIDVPISPSPSQQWELQTLAGLNIGSRRRRGKSSSRR
jgi:hypothetical protein